MYRLKLSLKMKSIHVYDVLLLFWMMFLLDFALFYEGWTSRAFWAFALVGSPIIFYAWLKKCSPSPSENSPECFLHNSSSDPPYTSTNEFLKKYLKEYERLLDEDLDITDAVCRFLERVSIETNGLVMPNTAPTKTDNFVKSGAISTIADISINPSVASTVVADGFPMPSATTTVVADGFPMPSATTTATAHNTSSFSVTSTVVADGFAMPSDTFLTYDFMMPGPASTTGGFVTSGVMFTSAANDFIKKNSTSMIAQKVITAKSRISDEGINNGKEIIAATNEICIDKIRKHKAHTHHKCSHVKNSATNSKNTNSTFCTETLDGTTHQCAESKNCHCEKKSRKEKSSKDPKPAYELLSSISKDMAEVSFSDAKFADKNCTNSNLTDEQSTSKTDFTEVNTINQDSATSEKRFNRLQCTSEEFDIASTEPNKIGYLQSVMITSNSSVSQGGSIDIVPLVFLYPCLPLTM